MLDVTWTASLLMAEEVQLLAGALKRVDQEVSEELIMYRTMLDLIKPKLVYLDLPLFMALLSDLFPGVEQPPTPAGALRVAIEADLAENNLQVLPATASLLQLGIVHSALPLLNSNFCPSKVRSMKCILVCTGYCVDMQQLAIPAYSAVQPILAANKLTCCSVSLDRWCLSLSPKSSRSLTAKWPGMET